MTPVRDFRRAGHTSARGRAAERDGAAWLAGRGYRVLERNVTTRAGEVDVIAYDGDTLCFVEIKARIGPHHGGALEAVDRRKQRQIASAAAVYLASSRHHGPCRFDVLAMDADGDGWRYTLVRNAFEVQ